MREAREGPRKPQLADLPGELHPEVLGALQRAGIERLYRHQERALQTAWRGPTIVTTGTASGKSLCFQLPTLEVLCRDPRARALYLYPTKALAQDQARALDAFGLSKRVRPAIYDGDTPRAARADIRRNANVVLTNPDMLHVGILPNHAAWGELFANLAVVAIDEAHVYRGVFGSHVACVLRRLRRIAAAYGTQPRLLLTSATIANPRELAERLTGLEDFALIDDEHSPAPGRRIAMWNPPLTDEALGTRRSALAEAAELLARLLCAGARSICFMKSRKGVELLSRLVAQELAAGEHPELAERIAPYRAGYTPQQRRELERRLTSGELRAVIATDALELGIDIGELDAALVVTFPGTVASLRQMWGSPGGAGAGWRCTSPAKTRSTSSSAAVPSEFLERPVEAAPFRPREPPDLPRPPALRRALGPARAGRRGVLRPPPAGQRRAVARCSPAAPAHAPRDSRRYGRERQWRYLRAASRDRYPAAEVSLRSAGSERFAIVDFASGSCPAIPRPRAPTRPCTTAPSTCIKGARTRFASWTCATGERSWLPSTATGTPSPSARPRRRSSPARSPRGARRAAGFGMVSVTETVLAYQRERLSDHGAIDLIGLDLPETSLLHAGALVPARQRRAGRYDPAGVAVRRAACHRRHADRGAAAAGDVRPLGHRRSLHNLHPQTGKPTIFLYGGHPGAWASPARRVARFDGLCPDALALIDGCGCARAAPRACSRRSAAT